MNLQAVYVLWLREIKRLIRARSRLVANLMQPLLFLVILGFGLSAARFPGFREGIRYLDFLAPGMIVVAVAFSSMFSGVLIIWDRQFGFLKEVLVAPVSRLSIVVGKTLGGSTVAMFQGLAILTVSALMGVKINALGLTLGLLFMLLTSFFAVGIGLIIASRLSDFEGFSLIMNLLIMPMILLSTAFFPLESAPTWMKWIIYLDPLTYAVDGLRGALIGQGALPLIVNLIVLTVLCTFTLLLGAYLFRRCEA
ncbi:MAG: multidrug ABC transporter permease [Thermoprotei archaeon]|nr:MAG: multidrug ABC transporter permease [Thermoprotei archaeon]